MSAKCGQVNQNHYMFAGQNPCAKTLNKCRYET